MEEVAILELGGEEIWTRQSFETFSVFSDLLDKDVFIPLKSLVLTLPLIMFLLRVCVRGTTRNLTFSFVTQFPTSEIAKGNASLKLVFILSQNTLH